MILPEIRMYDKSYSNALPLPSNWVECNGQTLSDSESPFNGQVIPNYNGYSSGADTLSNSKQPIFFRGGTTSGVYTADQFQGHKHTLSPADPLGYGFNDGSTSIARTGDANTGSVSVGNPKDDGTNGTPRTGSETHPKQVTIVFVMRIK